MAAAKELNIREWDRREAYAYYCRLSNPFYMVTFRQEVTRLYDYTKARGLSFYEGMIWACTQALNGVDAFRVTSREGRLFLLDRRDPSFTDIKPGTERFHIVTMAHLPRIGDFCREASRLRKLQEAFIDPDKESDALIYYTCMPWIDLTALTNGRDLSAPGALEDSIPRIAWGRFNDENGKKTLGISVEVNHRFIDGIHIGRFAELLTCEMERLEP